MDICYTVGSQKAGDGAEDLPSHTLRRQEARSLIDQRVMKRIALQETISLVRLGVADHVRIPSGEHLKDSGTCAIVCAEALASGALVTLGGESVTADRGPAGVPARAWEVAWEAARERHRILPPAAGAAGRDVYISRAWPNDKECARLAHKLVYEMGYSQAEVSRIFERVDGYERPAMWTKQGINRILREEYDGDEPRYRTESGGTARQAGNLHLPGAALKVMAVLGGEGVEAEAKSFDAGLAEPHSLVCPVYPGKPEQALHVTMQTLIDLGIFRTLYVANPDAVFSSRMQRSVVYDLALFRGVQVVEDGTRIDPGRYNPLLREGTELFAALRIRDNATVAEESRSSAHALKTAAELRSRDWSVRKIAAELNEEAIPTSSGLGKWSPSAVAKLLSSIPEADR
ncbi:hypothetical protein ACFVU0_13985 [Streptomyces sp. NPDC058122]|uniref:hypothetical protein n=1 Tax=Streptomyces sp. NPDC058122 TaxID=3346349 RepID=UPI0036DFEA02